MYGISLKFLTVQFVRKITWALHDAPSALMAAKSAFQ